jgi:hypothetical protein
MFHIPGYITDFHVTQCGMSTPEVVKFNFSPSQYTIICTLHEDNSDFGRLGRYLYSIRSFDKTGEGVLH